MIAPIKDTADGRAFVPAGWLLESPQETAQRAKGTPEEEAKRLEADLKKIRAEKREIMKFYGMRA
jgi:hypothetical protein